MKRGIFLLFFTGSITFTYAAESTFDYGLFFNSHLTYGDERTSLLLEGGKPISFKDKIEISFDVEARNEPLFGSVLNIKLNDKHTINLRFIAPESEENYPALTIDETIYKISNDPIKVHNYFLVSVTFFPDKQKLFLKYGDITQTIPIELEKTNSMIISLGANTLEKQTDTAPINVKDIRIFENDKLIRYWELKQYNDLVNFDKINKIPAVANNPHWIIDDHIEWKKVYTLHTAKPASIAFDPGNSTFYILKEKEIITYNPLQQIETTIPIAGGYPAINYPGHLVFDTLRNCLVSYCLHTKEISTFSFKNNSWSKKTENTDEMRYDNHAVVYKDSLIYTFGGYGFYTFKKDLFEINLSSGAFKKEALNDITPRFSSTVVLVGDDLYILGGKGNKLGRQEFPSQCYNELYKVNLKTKEINQVCALDLENQIFTPTMYFDSTDSSLYAATFMKGGSLMKISLHDRNWQNMSQPHEFFSAHKHNRLGLYYSPQPKKMYLVSNGESENQNEIVILSINFPLISAEELVQTDYRTEKATVNKLITIGILLLSILFFFGIYQLRMRKKHSKKGIGLSEEVPDNMEESIEPETTRHFDRSRSAVSLLGGFNVRDKDGKDITSQFTSKLKGLLILLLLYTEKNPRGIVVKKIDDILWYDKDEEAARNNRNVTLRKLRILFETIGNMDIINDNGFLRIQLGEDVFCDYTTSLHIIEQMNRQKENVDSGVLEQLLELQLYGVLLPNTIEEWLDDFKGNYSSLSIDLLNEWLVEKKKLNKKQLIGIADTLFLHDPLNETALFVKCSIFFQSGKTGIAKNIYTKFCIEYKRLLAVDYKKPFSEFCK
jgi:two-component SAPR family response regulator